MSLVRRATGFLGASPAPAPPRPHPSEARMTRILVVDNYDSFVFTIVVSDS